MEMKKRIRIRLLLRKMIWTMIYIIRLSVMPESSAVIRVME